MDAREKSNSVLLIESPSIDVVSALYVLRVTFPTVYTRQQVPLRPALGTPAGAPGASGPPRVMSAGAETLEHALADTRVMAARARQARA